MTVTLIKLGGSVITRKREPRPFFDRQNVSRIAEEIAISMDRTVSGLAIVHGAGSYGHPIASKYDLAAGLKGNALAMAQCQALMNQLNSMVCLELAAKNIPAYPFQLSAGSISNNGTLIDVNTLPIERLMGLNVVPVIFGTPAYDESQGCAIISGDQIISYLSSALKASRVVFATNVDGIFDGDPDKNRNAKIVKSLNADELEKIGAGTSSSTDVTGGMSGKIRWILAMRGLTCRVINGNVPGLLAKALSGDDGFGTVIKL